MENARVPSRRLNRYYQDLRHRKANKNFFTNWEYFSAHVNK